MCGITGISSLSVDKILNQELIIPLSDGIIHRGPDESGSFISDHLLLAIRRLSIIDLNTGSQPIYNEDKTIVVVYNGEIYNYLELRNDLISKGHKFATHSDTEVLVHLYEQEGIKFLSRLNGMFAFAIYDLMKRRLFIARDRYGVKPLFYSFENGLFAFCSEIKPLSTFHNRKKEINLQALSNYLTFSFVAEPWTIFKGIHRLPAGHYIIHDHNGLEIKKYFDLDFSQKIKITKSEAEIELSRLFIQAVERQLISDVPVSLMLSGGLDSRSILAATMKSGKKISSFTITYKEQLFDESDQASYWANFFKSDHYKMLYNESIFCSQLLQRQKHIGEPYGFFCDTAYYALAEYIKSKGIKVILSGAGGDELFAGYPTLNAAFLMNIYNKIPQVFTNLFIKNIINLLPAGKGNLPLSFKLKSFVNANDKNIYRAFLKFKEVITSKLKSKLFRGTPFEFINEYDPFVVYEQYLENIIDFELIDSLSYLDFKVFLGGNLFFSGDNEFMAASVEQRVPFIDNDLIQFSLSLPAKLKFHPLKLKLLLKSSLEKNIIDYRKNPPKKTYKKIGFEIPIIPWLKNGCFNKIVKDQLLNNDYFNKYETNKIVESHNNGKSNNERIIQNLLSLKIFLDENF
jgi:asparagine synthase (glutamine-hydrolysing)